MVIKPTRSAGPDERLRAKHAHALRALLAELPHGMTMADAQGPCSPTSRSGCRTAQGTARRQLRGHRPHVPCPRHARRRRAPALPGHRRQHHQGTLRWFPAPTSSPRPRLGGHRALGDIKDSVTNFDTTARPSSSPRRARTVPRRSGSPSASWAAKQQPTSRVAHTLPLAAGPMAAVTGNVAQKSNLRHVSREIFGENRKSGKTTAKQQVSYLSLPFQPAGSPEGLIWHMVGVAQLAERLVVVQEVAGSTPVAHPHEGRQ